MCAGCDSGVADDGDLPQAYFIMSKYFAFRRHHGRQWPLGPVPRPPPSRRAPCRERALRRSSNAASRSRFALLPLTVFRPTTGKVRLLRSPASCCLLETHLARAPNLASTPGVRITAIGRRDRIPESARQAIECAENHEPQSIEMLHLRIAIDYSSRDTLLDPASESGPGSPTDRPSASSLDSPDVDLLIRTGGEQRLSDFLLWECAYAELLFTPCLCGPTSVRRTRLRGCGISPRASARFGGLPKGVSGDRARDE